MIVQASTTNITQRPGGMIAHQALLMIASSLNAFSIKRPHEIELGSPEAEERDERLGEDRIRDQQHGVRDQERRHLWQDMAHDQPGVAGAERASALHVDALPDALRLRAQQPRGERPVDDPDDDDDVPGAATEERCDDDHQRNVRNHQEVVGHAHECGVRLPAEEAGEDADRAADERRDRSGTEADEQRDPGARDQHRDHARATTVGAERKLPARRLEHRAYLSLRVTVDQERPGHGEEDEEAEHSDRDQSGLVAEDGGSQRTNGKRWRGRRSLGSRHAGLNGTHSVTRGSNLK